MVSKEIRRLEKRFLFLANNAFIIGLGIAAFLLILYFLNFNGSFGDQSTFGTFGDFLGGVLNPMLGFITILFLVYATRLQVIELKETTKELKATKDTHNENLKMQREFFELNFLSAEMDRLIDKVEENFNWKTFISPEASTRLNIADIDKTLNVSINEIMQFLKPDMSNEEGLRPFIDSLDKYAGINISQLATDFFLLVKKASEDDKSMELIYSRANSLVRKYQEYGSIIQHCKVATLINSVVSPGGNLLYPSRGIGGVLEILGKYRERNDF